MTDPIRHKDAVRLAKRDVAADLRALQQTYPGSTIRTACMSSDASCFVIIDSPDMPQKPFSRSRLVMVLQVNNWLQGLYRPGDLLTAAATTPPLKVAPSG